MNGHEDAPPVGEVVADYRRRLNLTMGELARRSGLDVSYISRIESGERGNPSDDTLVALARGLGVDPNELRLRVGRPAKKRPAGRPSWTEYVREDDRLTESDAEMLLTLIAKLRGGTLD